MKRSIVLLCVLTAWCSGVYAGYIGTKDAARTYAAQIGKSAFVAFPEVREQSVQWFDSLRGHWLDKPFKEQRFSAAARPGEYFTYQLAVWAIDSLPDVQVRFGSLKAGKDVIPADRMTCFNLGGVNHLGESFTKTVSVSPDRLQAMWIGVDMQDARPGTYTGVVEVSAGGTKQKIPLEFTVQGDPIDDHGYREGKRMARMNWLNNTIGIDDRITKQFIPLKRDGNEIDLLGRRFVIGSDGLPAVIQTYFTPSVQSIGTDAENILKTPFRFVVVKEDGTEISMKPGKIEFTEENASAVAWRVASRSKELDMVCSARFEFEGYADYKVEFTAKKPLRIKDIRLEVPVAEEKAEYMMGLNQEGGYRPEGDYHWKWDTEKNQDMLWIGNVNGGIRLKWRAENYRRPLVNIYYKFGKLNLPPSWGNGGAGGVDVSGGNDRVTVSAYSGRREMGKGETLHYDFELLVTPFRVVNKEVQFGDRYFHGGGTDESSKVGQARKAGANIINIHHAGDLYPFINYPYLDENVGALERIIDDAHANGMKMKFYYTTRELTKNTPEFWAFNSLNGEILFPGPGNASRTHHLHPNGPAKWLIDNVREKYIPAWYNHIDRGIFKGEVDLSVVTAPDGRLNNFYIGGLDWMVRNMHLDGVYIDDSALDRTTLRRARKVIDDNRPDGRMDLHSCNHFDPYFGTASCLNMYMDLLPYFDLCWIGEGRNYNRMPDHWLIEVAGIPYGLPGQMLQGGGNKWRGMVYGITNRAGWGGDPTEIWKFWDLYRIREKEMTGYWDRNNPVRVDNDMVKATVYKGDKETIIAVAGWGDSEQVCSLSVDWEKLGYDPLRSGCFMPEVSGFQAGMASVDLNKLIIPKGKGFLIVLRSN